MLIGDVARRSGVSARMLRHYDSIGLVRPTGRTGSGYREYSSDDIRRIFHIESLRSLGLSLKEAGRALDDPAFDPAELVGDLIDRTRERIADETRLLTRLQQIGVVGAAGWEDILQIVSLLQALSSDNAGRRQQAALAAADDVPMPVEALVEAVLSEADPNVAGALRWTLVQTGIQAEQHPKLQSGEDVLAMLAAGLRAPSAEVRKRAVRTIAEFPTDAATAQLQDALTNSDETVRRIAAVALGSRGAAGAVPTLVGMIVANTSDANAADALSALAGDPGDPALADRIATVLAGRIADIKARIAEQPVDEALGAGLAAARQRLTQALADIPGKAATWALAELTTDDDRAVALTATYVLTLRTGGPTGDRADLNGDPDGAGFSGG
ncbi:MerR family transcriptional regulator [Actinoplanes derwentensis]|uniref:DNA-binding transcriptional regulator, MerR family n=1 Tax=Actinoplanes derwentensis TaxID=113562 RepID=A0A1H1YY72_9ACTN|nr:MerR family transcriptional regulator [Actinoplanes derwentensis]GID81325.1 transcriptional regulator [Actinoplanes derwentensis]SDT25876.1 DNA-binding transcriptional regulator, MerR family [Actinoplanes derwentensis]